MLSKDEDKSWANGTSGEDGVVCCMGSGGVKGAVDGSVVNVEKTGGDTNLLSFA